MSRVRGNMSYLHAPTRLGLDSRLRGNECGGDGQVHLFTTVPSRISRAGRVQRENSRSRLRFDFRCRLEAARQDA